MSDLTKQQHLEIINTIIKDVKFAMLTTITTDEKHLHACPMTTRKSNVQDGKIWFIGDKTTETVKDIQQNPQVNLSYASADQKDYVSITGVAKLVEDKAMLDDLWSPMDAAFFEQGKEDPNIQLICVEGHGAEYWQSGNSMVNMFRIASAALQDGKTAEDIGKNGKVSF